MWKIVHKPKVGLTVKRSSDGEWKTKHEALVRATFLMSLWVTGGGKPKNDAQRHIHQGMLKQLKDIYQRTEKAGGVPWKLPENLRAEMGL